MKKKIGCISVLILFPFLLRAQGQDLGLFSYNVVFGGITSGIGAVINKQKGQPWHKCFVRGLWQGGIGGALNYSAKKTLHLIERNESLVFAWPAKILHSAGTSIMDNAATNEPFLQNWNFDIGPVRVDFSVNGRKPTRVRFLPTVITSVYENARMNTVFDLGATLQTGVIMFKGTGSYLDPNDPLIGNSPGRAVAFLQSYKYYVIPHELVHVFQYREHLIFNSWLKPIAPKLVPSNIRKIFDKYIYPDIPFFHGLYLMQKRDYGIDYYKNFYEFEAERFATNRFVVR